VVDPLKAKKLTNIRAAGKDDNVLLTPPIKLTLEYAVEFIADDELAEVTPQSIRIRKRFLKGARAEAWREGRRAGLKRRYAARLKLASSAATPTKSPPKRRLTNRICRGARRSARNFAANTV
jgi:hypothetical protein